MTMPLRRRYGHASLTSAQERVVAKVRAGELTSAGTNTREGHVVERLIKKGVLGYANRTLAQAEVTYHGRRIPGDWYYGGLHLKETP